MSFLCQAFTPIIPGAGGSFHAMEFDGSAYLNISSHIPTDLTTIGAGFSLAFWVQHNTATGQEIYMGHRSTINQTPLFLPQREPTDVLGGLIRDMSSNSVSITTTEDIGNTNWLHVALSMNFSGDFVYYLNASDVLTASVTSIGMISSSETYLGAYKSAATLTGFLDGKVRQLQMYASAITPANVATLYNEGKFGDVTLESPYLSYRDIWVDTSGNGRDATNSGVTQVLVDAI